MFLLQLLGLEHPVRIVAVLLAGLEILSSGQ